MTRRIKHAGKVYDVVDETPTHYICEPTGKMTGYHYIAKRMCRLLENYEFEITDVFEYLSTVQAMICRRNEPGSQRPGITLKIGDRKICIPNTEETLSILATALLACSEPYAEAKDESEGML